MTDQHIKSVTPAFFGMGPQMGDATNAIATQTRVPNKLALPSTAEDEQRMRLAPEWAMSFTEVYVHRQRKAMQPLPIDIYDVFTWAIVVVFLGYAHAQNNWDRLRAKWNNSLPERMLLRMTALIRGQGRKGQAKTR